MRHYILTRSAFGSEVSLEENRHRLELLRRVTAPSLAAQLNRDLTWIVLMAPDDPMADDRRAAFESAGLPLVFGSAAGMTVRGQRDKPYGPWARYIARDGITLTTRMDDDDALAPWAMALVRETAEKANSRRRTVWSLMDGWRIAGSMAERAHWPIPMFCTLQAPAGDRTTIMDANHLGAKRLGVFRTIASDPAWLWVRHGMTRSSHLGEWTLAEWREKAVPISPEIRAAFPVDWDLIESMEADQWT